MVHPNKFDDQYESQLFRSGQSMNAGHSTAENVCCGECCNFSSIFSQGQQSSIPLIVRADLYAPKKK